MYNVNYEGHFPLFYKNIPIANTTTLDSDNKMTWHSPSCFDSDESFICKNMNYYPLHIDAAIQGLTDEELDKIRLKKIIKNIS